MPQRNGPHFKPDNGCLLRLTLANSWHGLLHSEDSHDGGEGMDLQGRRGRSRVVCRGDPNTLSGFEL